MKLPPLWSDDYSIDANIARQLIVVGSDDAEILVEGGKLVVKVGKKKWNLLKSDEEFTGAGYALKMVDQFTSLGDIDLENTMWIGDKSSTNAKKVSASLDGSFELVQEDQGKGVEGLRTPQIGAIQTVLGQWTVKSKKPMTVVLPTGTGKTETMLALFASARPERLLVLVPSDALRIQLAQKFEDYGVLKKFSVVKDKALFPVVGRIEHGFTSKLGATGFATACNVMIATPGALNSSPPEFRNELLALCSHLFVDEAHHITANTWRQVRDEFVEKPVVQFTATPYRTDGKDLGGRLVYNFPLKLSQEQGYFSKINYVPVVDFDNQDEAIAKKALERLRKDLDNGFDHILMARASSTNRADELVQLYERLDPELKPVVIYNSISLAERTRSRGMIDSRESRVLVCVNMFGEGFDMPSLKVAAIHDPHKTLGITLQFIGRFARVKDGSLGEASVVVNKTDPQHDRRLRELYAEDNDWNFIIQNLSANAVGEQEDADEFSDGFAGLPDDISLRNIIPKMSTVVYRTSPSSWHPVNLESHFGDKLYTKTIAVNNQEHVAWLVTKTITPSKWSDLKTFDEEIYDLYIFYWDSTNKLLYINSSGNDGVYEDLAKALCGDDVERFKGDEIYRPLATVKRRVATNVGLLDTRNRDKSFEMQMGANVDFTSAESRNKTQTNIFAHGFDEKTAENVTVGASRKGRIWSHKGAPSIKHWMAWCDSIGAKLIDTSITTDDVTNGFIKPVRLDSRPEGLVALTLEW